MFYGEENTRSILREKANIILFVDKKTKQQALNITSDPFIIAPTVWTAPPNGALDEPPKTPAINQVPSAVKLLNY